MTRRWVTAAPSTSTLNNVLKRSLSPTENSSSSTPASASWIKKLGGLGAECTEGEAT